MISVCAFILDSARIDGLSDADFAILRDAMVEEAVALAGTHPAIRSVEVIPTGSGEMVFGHRLRDFAVKAFASGADAVILLGTQTPTLPPEILSIAVDALTRRMSFVIGRDTAGGAYLLGINDLYFDAFTEIDHDDFWWGGSDQYDRMLEIATEASDRVTILPEWNSVTDESSLNALADPARSGALGSAILRARTTISRSDRA